MVEGAGAGSGTAAPGGDPRDDAGDAEDRALLAAHVAGDPRAFDALVRRHRDRLWAVAARTLDDREDAADALQDALLSACRRAASYRGEARVTTWLHRIVVNACLDRARRGAVRATVPLPEQLPAGRDPLADSELALKVRAALAALPPEQRLALVLVDLHGLPVAEAALVLEVPEGTVKSRCARGRARLAVALGHLAPPVRNAGAPAAVPPAGPSLPDADDQAGAP